MEKIVEVRDLKKDFKEVKAVKDISFQVEAGELFGFLGVNGAGKSTTINMLCTLIAPSGGEARVCGYTLGKENEKIRQRIGVVYQNNCLDERLSVKENLFIRGSLYERSRAKLKEQLFYVSDILSLGDVMNRRFGRLSGGQKRKCEIARALMNRPELLFLDEPTTGLDPATRKTVWKSVKTLQKELGMSVFLTTHYMEEAAEASHIAVIDEGSIKEFGTPLTLKEKYAYDRLSLEPEDPAEMKKLLLAGNLSFKEREECFSVRLKNTLEAVPLLREWEKKVKGFEVRHGSMDDVFLNITGKELAVKKEKAV